jgi:hypothetical protein
VKSLPEPVLKALAKFHLAQFARRREDEIAERQAAKDAKEIKIKWVTVGATIATVAVSTVALVLKWLKVL